MIKARNTLDLFLERNGHECVKVIFKPPYDANQHARLPLPTRMLLRKSKVSVFSVQEEAFAIVQLLNNQNDVLDMYFI